MSNVIHAAFTPMAQAIATADLSQPSPFIQLANDLIAERQAWLVRYEAQCRRELRLMQLQALAERAGQTIH